MLKFKVNHEQKNALEGLAYWIADSAHMRERYGDNEPELQICADTLENSIFPRLDALQVPFWVQNAVIAYAQDWRRYTDCYFWPEMAKINITL